MRKNSFATNTFFNNNILQNEMTVSILFCDIKLLFHNYIVIKNLLYNNITFRKIFERKQ